MKTADWINIWIIVIITWTFIPAGHLIPETYVSPATVRLQGKIYDCGTITVKGVRENLDDMSLYCRGYADGYQWATTQCAMN